MEYDFRRIEDFWKKEWAKNKLYEVKEDPNRLKLYVLDMFPYPSGAGLHVGHPLGYVASDIYARYKRLKGFNVLHPMGYDAFGLPAEQYAIETGTHPAITTDKAIKRYREQLDKIGFSFDWSREVKTSDPKYYKWTQWIFLKLFNSWYNREKDRAEPIETLVEKFRNQKSEIRNTGKKWDELSEKEQQQVLMDYRLAFLSYAEVNWCPALGTVLANDEVKDGKSERGGHPVERRKMRQWFLRITEYSDRLLEGLDRLDWSESMKEIQRNWIGRSEGAAISFKVLTPNPSPKERGTVERHYMTGEAGASKKNIIYAKENRKNPTGTEDLLWQNLRNEKLGYKFRRQHLIDKYIVDFVCLSKGLVVEVDGGIHLLTKAEDEARTERLNELGFKVIRFTNDEVLNDISKVLKKMKSELGNLKENSKEGSASPLLWRGAGGEDLEEGPGGEVVLSVFTTRPDTIFGATFMVIAPEHELVEQLTTPEQKQEVEKYIAYVKSRNDVERQQEKKVTGVFTGSYAINPFTDQPIPVWIAEYVLIGYGTGAIMAVPADDERDNKFATKFGLPIVEIIDKSAYPNAQIGDKVGKMINSGFLNGLEVKDAIKKILEEIEDLEIGERKVNYKQRDAGYSRQRYWGEPFPIKYNVIGKPDGHFIEGEHDDIPVPLSESELPLILPEVSSYKPTGDGSSPLANNAEWVAQHYETDTMPGYAGSSWYFLRYMDAHNDKEFAAKDKMHYWGNVDVYFGGAEHAVGHLLYARMWHKFLYDLGYVKTDEPFQKLVNQGMIQGVSAKIFRYDSSKLSKYYKQEFEPYFTYMVVQAQDRSFQLIGQDRDRIVYYSADMLHKYSESFALVEDNGTWINIDVRCAENGEVDIDKLIEWRSDFQNAVIVCSGGYYMDGSFYPTNDFSNGNKIKTKYEVEKMSKSKYNVVNPDDVIDKYGADCFRMFEMFLGPIEQSKPWDDKGISGVYNFLRKFWRMYTAPPNLPKGEEQGLEKASQQNNKGAGSPASEGLGEVVVTDDKATPEELKVLHKTLKKISEDIEKLSFNTSVSAFMIATNELTALGCNKREILEPLLVALAPFAPFITEELWAGLGHKDSVHKAVYPKVEEKYLTEDSFNYPVSINGKVRAQVNLSLTLEAQEVEKQILEMDSIKKWTNGNPPKKFIFVKGKIINVVV